MRCESHGRSFDVRMLFEDYFVTVTNVLTERSHVYQGGPRHKWVAQFSRDLANGTYGDR